jgi:nucleoside phosphorylase
MQCRIETNEACDSSRHLTCAQVGCDISKLTRPDHSSREKVRSSTIQRDVQSDMLKPDIHFGIVASGNHVMKSGEDRDAVAKSTGAIAFEMESAGVWNYIPCVVIKGVCD